MVVTLIRFSRYLGKFSAFSLIVVSRSILMFQI